MSDSPIETTTATSSKKIVSAMYTLVIKASSNIPSQLATAIEAKLVESGFTTLDDFELNNRVIQSLQSAIRSAASSVASAVVTGSFESALSGASPAFVDAYSRELDILNAQSRKDGINVSKNIIVLSKNITTAMLAAAKLDASALLAAAHQKDDEKKK